MIREEYFKNSNNYISEADMVWCSDYCRRRWPEEAAHMIRIADDAADQRFLFDLRWDMERTYEPVVFDGEIIWDFKPGDDPEFIFQFNRHQYFICLGQAYAMTGEEGYARVFAELLRSWIQKNPLTEETRKTTWRSIEAGIRAENWVKAMGYFKNSTWIDESLMEDYCACLTVHAEYLMTTYQDFQIKSNWGVIENRGLMELALALPQTERTKEYLTAALERLYEESQIQILDDGAHWEQSPMYHNEVFHCYLEVLRLAGRYGIALQEEMTERIRRMAYANLTWKKPNHCQVMQGDSDETDIRDLLAQSALLFADPTLKGGAYDGLDYDGAWDHLKAGVLAYEALPCKRPDFLDRFMEVSGNLYLRSGWGEEDDFFHFRCGFLGGGHGHSDKLHMDLVIHGEDVLMDTGRYHYVPGGDRTWFKSGLGHNVPLIDGQDYMTCKDAWAVGGRTAAYMGNYVKKGEFHYIRGGHAGFLNAGKGNVFINRNVIGIGTGLYVIVDEFFTGERHRFQQLFHFNNQGEVAADGRRISYTGTRAEADVMVLSDGCRLELTNGWISRNYNQKEPGRQLLVEREAEGFCTIVTVIAGFEAKKRQKWNARLVPVRAVPGGAGLEERDAQAVALEWKGREYVLLFAHRDIGDSCDLLEAEGVKGLGKVIMFDKAIQTTGGTVLQW